MSWRAVELDNGDRIPRLEDYDALWVMGGPMDVWQVDDHPWLIEEKEAIRHWVLGLKRPFLGICLGHQLLADALGGKCKLSDKAEIGVLDVELTEAGVCDPLFAGMPRRQKVLQWHSVNVVAPPAGARILASSKDCSVQAMRVGGCAWSTQFHVEAEDDTVDNWSAIPEYRRSMEKSVGRGALELLRTATAEALPKMTEMSRMLFENFSREVERASTTFRLQDRNDH